MASEANTVPQVTMLSDRGRVLRRGTRLTTIRYKGLTAEVETPGWWPDDLDDYGDAVLVGDDMRPGDEALRLLMEQADGPDFSASDPEKA